MIKIGAIRGRNSDNPKSRQSGLETEQMLEINENGTSNALTTIQKDNVVVISTNNSKGFDLAEEEEEEEDSINFSNPNSETRRGRVGKKVSQTLDTQCNQGVFTQQRIRRLTELECFRLMDFPDSLIENNNFIKDISNQGILVYLQKNIDLWENVQLKDVKENTQRKDIALCTIKDGKNMETQSLFSNIHIEKIQNVQYKIAINKFTQKDIAYLTTIPTENMEILCLESKDLTKLEKKPLKELLIQMENQDLESLENQNTELFMKITLGESWKKMKQSIILIAIQTIMKSIISTYTKQNQTTLWFIWNYEESLEKSHLDLSKKELLCLKMVDMKPVSGSQLYKQAGNSICVGVLAAIISKLKI